MDEIQMTLQKCKLFMSFPPETLHRSILPHGKLREFQKNEIVIAPQQQVDWFAVLIRGQIHISQLFSDGGSSLMASLQPSFVLGGDLVCTQGQRSPYYAIATTPVQAMVFPVELLAPALLPEEERQMIWERLMVLIAHENMRKFYRLAILSQRSLRSRILVYLTMQAGRRGTDTFRIPFSREELAAFLCVNRSALSRELGRLKQEGIIHFQRNQFTILKKSDLWANDPH
ncbi:Crp/Fnr family transcriptional regulator [Anaerotruncus colihominis]|uniref:Crp/Fnr family transcriptional regulator n=1 Tax=Anaerotruncus colihominis TaxID=169435 RepID=UPI002672FD65|nr:Crp/Fnr family transcriptional regulator [Anaerotruncus colihominis]